MCLHAGETSSTAILSYRRDLSHMAPGACYVFLQRVLELHFFCCLVSKRFLHLRQHASAAAALQKKEKEKRSHLAGAAKGNSRVARRKKCPNLRTFLFHSLSISLRHIVVGQTSLPLPSLPQHDQCFPRDPSSNIVKQMSNEDVISSLLATGMGWDGGGRDGGESQIDSGIQ